MVIIVGAYGSGKTEVSINLAVYMNRKGTPVRLADLDLVNPYFRSREARHVLGRLGIDLVLPASQYMQADLPILTPEVSGMLRHPSGLTLLDVGGDDVGATVLAALSDPLADQTPQVLQVINPHRPYTDTVQGCLDMRSAIEEKSKLGITGIVGNANLMDATGEQDILSTPRGISPLIRRVRTIVFIARSAVSCARMSPFQSWKPRTIPPLADDQEETWAKFS
jgi:hypothetical protein